MYKPSKMVIILMIQFICMKRFKFVVFALLLILATYSLYRTYQNVRGKAVKIDDLANNVNKVEEENSKLREDIAVSKTREFIEQEAIEKLGLVKPNQKIIVVPNKEDDNKLEDINDLLISTVEEEKWQKWFKLFTKNNPFKFRL